MGAGWAFELWGLPSLKDSALYMDLHVFLHGFQWFSIGTFMSILFRKAVALLSRMATRLVRLDAVSYAAAVAALGQGQRWSDALQLLDRMQKEELKQISTDELISSMNS